jgi:hypothetical protein
MPLTQLGKAQWQSWFDHLSRALPGQRVEIEVTGLDLGDQIEAEWIPLIGISYDARNNVLSVAAEGVEHLIRRPTQVHVDRDGDWLHSMEVVDADGHHHIMMLKDPVALPAS